MEALRRSTEHNNLRIAILEQRNSLYRDIQTKGIANANTSIDYTLYHPIRATAELFNREAVYEKEKSQEKEVERYIIGSLSKEIRVLNADQVQLFRTTQSEKTLPPINSVNSRPSTGSGRPISAKSQTATRSRPQTASSTKTAKTRPRSAFSDFESDFADSFQLKRNSKSALTNQTVFQKTNL